MSAVPPTGSEVPPPALTLSAPSTEAVAMDHGQLPPWQPADLPEPLPFSFRNTLRTIGPGAILLAGAIVRSVFRKENGSGSGRSAGCHGGSWP